MRYVIKEARTVEDAIKEALLELEVTEADVEIEVIEEASRGLFGLIGSKDAKVKVTVVNDPVMKSKEFLENIFKYMGVVADMEIRREEDGLYIDIVNVDPIESLQELL